VNLDPRRALVLLGAGLSARPDGAEHIMSENGLQVAAREYSEAARIVATGEMTAQALIQERARGNPLWGDLVKTIEASLLKCMAMPSSFAALEVVGDLISLLRAVGIPVEFVSLELCDYDLYLKTEHWKIVREMALEHFERRCGVCNSSENLHVHHRTYERRGKEDPRDVIVLCRACHRIFHDNGRLAKEEE
jgi:hypothetical protein